MKLHPAHGLALQAIDLLMDVETPGPEGDLLSDLADAVEKYEKAMIEPGREDPTPL